MVDFLSAWNAAHPWLLHPVFGVSPFAADPFGWQAPYGVPSNADVSAASPPFGGAIGANYFPDTTSYRSIPQTTISSPSASLAAPPPDLGPSSGNGAAFQYNQRWYGQFAQYAQAQAQQYGVPWPLFRAVITKESGWNPAATSPTGNYGFTQLGDTTAQTLGVNREDPYQNIKGGAQYLSQLYKKYGNWNDALGAYNSGPTGYDNVLAGKRSLPAETADYIPTVTSWAKAYGWTGASTAGTGTANTASNPYNPVVPQGGRVEGQTVSQPSPDQLKSAGITAPKTTDAGLQFAGMVGGFISSIIGGLAGGGSSTPSGPTPQQAAATVTGRLPGQAGPSSANPNLTAGDFANPFAKLFGIVDPFGLTGKTVSTDNPSQAVPSIPDRLGIDMSGVNAFLAMISDPKNWLKWGIYIIAILVALFLIVGPLFSTVVETKTYQAVKP